MGSGGTQIWCPVCKDIRVVEALKPSSLGALSDNRVQTMIGNEDITFFQRGRQCQTCYHCWISAEVPVNFIHELASLRIALRNIKKNAEAYSKEAEIAAESLVGISKSLSDLSVRITQT